MEPHELKFLFTENGFCRVNFKSVDKNLDYCFIESRYFKDGRYYDYFAFYRCTKDFEPDFEIKFSGNFFISEKEIKKIEKLNDSTSKNFIKYFHSGKYLVDYNYLHEVEKCEQSK